jgi:hypothetical protein
MTVKYSFEVPLNHLDEFSDNQDYIFSLSYLYKDKRYKDYIFKEKSKGKIIYLDNSYNELKKADSIESLCNLYEEIQPDYIICPDDNTFTVIDYLHIFDKMLLKIPFDKLFLVVRNYFHLHIFENSNIDNFAIPYKFRPWYMMKPKLKGFLMEESYLFQNNHFLGYNQIAEPETFQAATCDTSMPIKLAIEGLIIKEWYEKGSIHIDSTPDFFNITMTDEQIRLAKENIKIIKGEEVCKNLNLLLTKD